MYIKCWGSRGSIPVSGPLYDRYGGDTTCMELRSRRNDVIVIDAGSGIRLLGNKLLAENVKSFDMLFTHAHWDHILGFGFFKPTFHKDRTITVHGRPFNLSSYRDVLRGLMHRPFFPVELSAVPSTLIYKNIGARPFKIGSLRVRSVPLSHPNGGVGFRFEEDGKSFVFLTDNELQYIHKGGLKFDDYVDFCRGADLLIHDAEFTQKDYKHNRTWGHSRYSDAVKLGLAAKVKRLGLFHINQDRTDDMVDDLVAHARAMIAKSKSTMECCAVGNSFKIEL
ncbi:MAG: MBL fold metallo-hydrolase [Chitinivibrionales bacterium]|nr:MBL fold metallo-hydrolase [Chitinivibrionales bacterium]